MSVCGFFTQSFPANMTTATSVNVTATKPTDTAALTTTISTGVGEPTDGYWDPNAAPDDSNSPDAGARFGVSQVGVLGVLFVGVMMGM